MSKPDSATFRQVTVLIGLVASIVLVGVSLFNAARLSNSVLDLVSRGIDPLALRLVLSSTALFIAIAFASLGFGLFLIGAEGSFKMEGSVQGKWPGFETTAPGLVVVVCATVVVFLALRISFDVTQNGHGGVTTRSSVAAPPEPIIDFGALDAALDAGTVGGSR